MGGTTAVDMVRLNDSAEAGLAGEYALVRVRGRVVRTAVFTGNGFFLLRGGQHSWNECMGRMTGHSSFFWAEPLEPCEGGRSVHRRTTSDKVVYRQAWDSLQKEQQTTARKGQVEGG